MASDNEEANKKRKANSNNKIDEDSKKQKTFDTEFTEVVFKFRLRDSDTITDGLEDFVKLAEAHSDGVQCTDIVSNYLTSSPDCTELLGLLDITQKKLTLGQIVLVYECLTHILKYIQTEPQFKSTGDTILQRILSAHFGQMYNYLRSQNKSKTVKTTIHFLISLVMLSDKAKKAVLSKLNFEHEVFRPLFDRRDRNDPEDVRSCLVLLTMSFIIDGDSELINALVQQKGFIQMTLGGLMHDRKEIVLDVLATLLDKVLRNPNVTKTAKIKLFSEKILRQIIGLYDWEGPQGWTRTKVKKRNEPVKEFLNDEEFLEEREAVVEMVHEFLVVVCCSQRNGIIFFDKKFGTGPRNLNQLLTHLLQSLSSKLEHPLRRELAVQILKACPDQLFYFLPTWTITLNPRWSEKWEFNMNFLIEVYENLIPLPSFLVDPDATLKDVDSLVSMATVYFLPSQKIAASLTQGIKIDDLRVRHLCLLLIHGIVQNTQRIVTAISSQKYIPDASVCDRVTSLFTSLVIRTLPPSATLFGCVEKVLDTLSSPKTLEAVGVEVDLVDHVTTLVKTLKLYQDLCPSLLSERPRDVARLVEAVGKLQLILDETLKETDADSDSKSIVLPQLDLLQLLSVTDAKTLSLGREGLLEKLLRSAHHCSKEKDKEKTVSLVCKMLTSLEVFANHEKELHLWIGVALTYETQCAKAVAGPDNTDKNPSHFSLIAFLSICLCAHINNPMPYLDQVIDVLAEVSDTLASSMDVDENDSDGAFRAGLRKSELEEIMKMKDEDLELTQIDLSMENLSHQTVVHPFSPLSSIALEKLHYSKGDKKTTAEYISTVLVKILHSQVDPRPYSVLVNKCKEKLPKGVAEYFEYWTGKKTSMKDSTVDLVLSIPFTCDLLNWFMSADESYQKTSKVDIEEIPYEEKMQCLHQAIFYMEHCMSSYYNLGQKMKRVKVLRKAIENIFASFVLETTKSQDNDEAVVRELIHSDDKNKNNSQDKISTAALCILNNNTFKPLFLSSNSSTSVSDKSEKLELSVSRLLSNILSQCKTLELSESCVEVLQEYLNKALDHLSQDDQDIDNYLTVVETVICHFDLAAVNRCICTFLRLSKASFFSADISDENVLQVNKGKKNPCLTKIGEIFIATLEYWTNILKIYEVIETKENLLLLSFKPDKSTKISNIPALDCETDHSSVKIHKCLAQTSEVWLDISDLKSLFDFLPLCSNFDSVICGVVKQIPQLSLCCSQKTFKSLISQYSSLGNERKMLVEVMLASSDSFHKLAGSHLEQHVSTVIKKGHFTFLRAYLERQEKGNEEAVVVLCEKLLASCTELVSSRDDNLLACWKALVRLTLHSESTFSRDLYSMVQTYITSNFAMASIHHFSFLQTIYKTVHAKTRDGGGLPPNLTDFDFLGTVLKHLLGCLSKKANRNPNLEEELIGLSLDCLQCGATLSSDFMANSWPSFVKSSLKHLYTKQPLLDLLSELTGNVYALEKNKSTDKGDIKINKYSACGGLSPKVMFEMCISHTAFLPTIMSMTDLPTKSSLVNLLYTMYSVEPSCVTKDIVSPFLGAYNATLSLTDQRLLKMLQNHLEDMEVKETFPVLWGKAYLDHRANSQVLGPSLDVEVAIKVVLAEIDPSLMHKSILHFDTSRDTENFTVRDPNETESLLECYDPCFLLRVFQQILSPSRLVQIRPFVNRECLGFLLICLTSSYFHCRLLAYQCLNEFYGHLETSHCPERSEFAYILDLLNASRDENAQQLCFIIGLFLSRAAKLVVEPSNPMYLPVIRFLLVKPEMELNNVPEFHAFFFSAGHNHTKERNWMLTLLRDGLRKYSDYKMYQRKSIFRILMSFYNSTLSDMVSQVLVLETIRNACRVTFIVPEFIQEHGLIPWLAVAVSRLKERPEQTELLHSIISLLCSSLGVSAQVQPVNKDGSKRGCINGAEVKKSKEDLNNADFGRHKKRKLLQPSEKADAFDSESGSPMVMSLNTLVESLNWYLSHVSDSSRSTSLEVKKHAGENLTVELVEV